MTQLPAPSEPGSPHSSRRGLLWGVAATAATAGLGVAAWHGGLFGRRNAPVVSVFLLFFDGFIITIVFYFI